VTSDNQEQYLDLLKRCLVGSIYEESGWELSLTSAQMQELEPRKGAFVRSARTKLLNLAHKYGWVLLKRKAFNEADRDEGKDWPLIGYTMVGRKRLDNVQQCVETVIKDGIEGDLVETGVWRGGTVIFMRALLKALGDEDRRVWVADSFEGLPAPAGAGDGMDLSTVDYLKVTQETVQKNFERFGLLDERVKFLKGWFCDTLPSAPIEKISVLRLDGDMYSSTMDALTSLFHKVSPGGFVIVDDYSSWESCRRAVHDFLDKKGLKPDIKKIDWTGAYWRV